MNKVLSILLLSICHSLKNHFVICQNYMLLTNNKDFLKVNDTITPLDTCHISFSLTSNSHGNFHIKIAFDYRFIISRLFMETKDQF